MPSTCLIEKEGRRYRFVDTAGIRRKSRVEEAVEYYSVLRSMRAAEDSDVVLMLIDAADGVTEQDKRIAGIGHEAGRALVIIVNKWDKLEKDEKTMEAYRENVRKELAYLTYAPILLFLLLQASVCSGCLSWWTMWPSSTHCVSAQAN
jgi:GTPase